MIALDTGTSTRSRASRALRLRSPRDTPLPLPMNVLLLRRTPSPKRVKGTFLRHEPTRRTSFYAAPGACLGHDHRSCSTALRAPPPADRWPHRPSGQSRLAEVRAPIIGGGSQSVMTAAGGEAHKPAAMRGSLVAQ